MTDDYEKCLRQVEEAAWRIVDKMNRDDAGDDARIAAASRREWAERAWRAEEELEIFRKSGIVEVAVRNPSVMDYMKHWEGRAEKAEAERDRLRKKLDEIAQTTTDVWVSEIARAALKGEM